jgi:UDP-N-acetylmuramoylalanine--D-glutamate ligase
MSFIAELRSKRVLIVGAGTTGKSLANYLQTLGVEFSIIDERVEPFDGLEVLSEIPDAIDFDLALVSPGWRKDHNFISNLNSRGIEVLSELDFAWSLKEELNPKQRWVALTGTNGKTTTVQMLESILRSAGKSAIACGNHCGGGGN